MTHDALHIATSIARPPGDVYEFVSNPANLPRWAAGLSVSINLVDGQWVAESDLGRIVVEFAPTNPFGVLDHAVTLPSGETVHNPLRVMPNGEGSEVVFSLFRSPGVSAADFAADAAAVERDLATLKELLEG